MASHEAERQEIIDVTKKQRFGREGKDLRSFGVFDPEHIIGGFTVRRLLCEESAAVLLEIAETIADEDGIDVLIPAREEGMGISVLDVKDAKYIFGIHGKSSAEIKEPVEDLLRTMPQEHHCNLGYGIVFGAPPGSSAHRFPAISLDSESRQRIMNERQEIYSLTGVSAPGILSPHVSLLHTEGQYEAAEKAALQLDSYAHAIDKYIEDCDNPTLKLVLGKPELKEIGLIDRR